MVATGATLHTLLHLAHLVSFCPALFCLPPVLPLHHFFIIFVLFHASYVPFTVHVLILVSFPPFRLPKNHCLLTIYFLPFSCPRPFLSSPLFYFLLIVFLLFSFVHFSVSPSGSIFPFPLLSSLTSLPLPFPYPVLSTSASLSPSLLLPSSCFPLSLAPAPSRFAPSFIPSSPLKLFPLPCSIRCWRVHVLSPVTPKSASRLVPSLKV